MSAQYRLYHYWRSSSSWRVRWAFAIKNLICEFQPINLLTDESESQSHLQRNPMGYVPVLEFLSTPSPIQFLCESVAIIEWLEEAYPKPSLFPQHPLLRARARQLAEIINSGTQPLQNPNVAQFHSQDPDEQKKWNQHWIQKGLHAYETLVCETSEQYSVGSSITFPDLFLIPQCYNALRNQIELEDFPVIYKIYQNALLTEACKISSPEHYKPA